MELSANEVEMLVLKAARGGGCPLGLAEDLAAAIRFVDLDALRGCPCDSRAVSAVPAALDALLSEGEAQQVEAEATLVAGYVAAMQDQTGVTVACRPEGDRVHLTLDQGETAVPLVPFGRRTLPAGLLAHLQEMAARILVPETEASRVAGAGAGLTDND